MKTRLERLRDKFAALELDAFFVSSPENRRYLSGFAGSAGYLLISRDAAVLATDFRYTEQAELQAPDFRVDRISGGLGWLPELFMELGVRRVGFESGHMTVALHSAIVTALKEDEAASEVSLIATAQFIDPLRAIKEPEELALLTRAMEIADHAFAVVAPTIEVGDTEESVAWRLELAMREAGAEAVAFETIIAAGPNAAKPHHHPTERRIAAGESAAVVLRSERRSQHNVLKKALSRRLGARWQRMLVWCAEADKAMKGIGDDSEWNELLELTLRVSGGRALQRRITVRT